MGTPGKEIHLQAVQDQTTGEWSVGILRDPIPLTVQKNDDGLRLKFVNKTPTAGDPPAIRLSFKGPVSRNAFQKPKPKDILKNQPYELKPKDEEVFEVREHLGIAEQGSGAPRDERIYPVKLKLGVGPTTSAGGNPGDTDILIEC